MRVTHFRHNLFESGLDIRTSAGLNVIIKQSFMMKKKIKASLLRKSSVISFPYSFSIVLKKEHLAKTKTTIYYLPCRYNIHIKKNPLWFYYSVDIYNQLHSYWYMDIYIYKRSRRHVVLLTRQPQIIVSICSNIGRTIFIYCTPSRRYVVRAADVYAAVTVKWLW